MWAMSNRDDREEQHSKKYVRLSLSDHRVYELRRKKIMDPKNMENLGG